jgi:AcrR family transcriptional regulator
MHTVSDCTPRERMIRSAALLMGEHGVEATSFSRVLEHSGAPRGSIYHHFPAGKAQLIEEATRYTGALLAAALTAALEQEDPLAGLDATAEFWRASLRDTDFAAGCPVVAATVEGENIPAARDAADEAFQSWERLHAANLRRHGIAEDRARSLATLIVAAIEGAIILARAERSSRPLERVVDELHTLLRDVFRHRRAH